MTTTHLFHATPTRGVPKILAEGLVGEPVHLSECDESEFIFDLYEMEPGGFFEFETGYVDTVALLSVRVDGLELDGPRAEEFVPDNDEHHMFWGTISPDRITVVEIAE